MLRKVLLVVGLMAMLTTLSLVAGEKTDHSSHANFEGKLVCLGCDLKGEADARSACKVFGHDHALKTEEGKYISFLPNQYSKDLINGEKYHNKELKVHGIYFANANQLDIESFEVDGTKKSWCGDCNAMDACMAQK